MRGIKIISGGRSGKYLARVGIFLTIAALITGIPVSYGVAGDDNQLSQNLEIYTWYDLNAVRDNRTGNHTLMNDLNATTPGYTLLASPTANGGKGWEPIAYLTLVGGGCQSGSPRYVGLIGTLDGQGHEICDLFINRPKSGGVGLFHSVEPGGVIQNIGVVNVTVTGRDTGGLVGRNYGNMRNCYASGKVTGDREVGGLVGTNYGTVNNCYASGKVTGDVAVGGLVGFVMGRISQPEPAGPGTVSNSYSTASVVGDECVGGLVGANGGSVNESYSTESVTGEDYVGGLVGINYDTVSNSFWDTETSGQATSDGGTGKNTTEMQDITTFLGATWDIIAVALNETNPTYIWNIVNNVTYPFLSWQS